MHSTKGGPKQKQTKNQPTLRKMAKKSHSHTLSIGDKAFQGLADLVQLLPTGTVFLFQFLNPLLTNSGQCTMTNKVLSGALLFGCSFFCCFTTFTDSYIGTDGKLYYGIVTRKGLWPFSDPNAGSVDLSRYKLQFGDFVHAFLSLAVFGVIAALDSNTVSCFDPALLVHQKLMLQVLPPVIGSLSSSVFMVFPCTRHGIGYPPTAASEDFTEKKLEVN
ncbi:hypothetical protein LUZ63_006178 [Rhynchospora breviuscula]|uniref:Uncharacterized protein n=1 Tax=Rhynchospora breviuscula TaxID=2022672 RepID=A0A9Q0CPJ7_9POAL|nr:hypothetical protein LUZ63_006178 [Rhynchospora breviuscula]